MGYCIERIERNVTEGRKFRLQLRIIMRPVRTAVTDHILEKSCIRLVETALNTAPQTGIDDFLTAAAGVHRVTGLMQIGENQVVAAVAVGGDTRVARSHEGGKRVHDTVIEAAAFG